MARESNEENDQNPADEKGCCVGLNKIWKSVGDPIWKSITEISKEAYNAEILDLLGEKEDENSTDLINKENASKTALTRKTLPSKENSLSKTKSRANLTKNQSVGNALKQELDIDTTKIIKRKVRNINLLFYIVSISSAAFFLRRLENWQFLSAEFFGTTVLSSGSNLETEESEKSDQSKIRLILLFLFVCITLMYQTIIYISEKTETISRGKERRILNPLYDLDKELKYICQRTTEQTKAEQKMIHSYSVRDNENDRIDVLEKWLVEPQHFMIAWFMQMTNLYSEKYDSYEMAEEMFKEEARTKSISGTDPSGGSDFAECKLANHEFNLLAKAYYKWFVRVNELDSSENMPDQSDTDEWIQFGRLLSKKLQIRRIKNITKKIVTMEKLSEHLCQSRKNHNAPGDNLNTPMTHELYTNVLKFIDYHVGVVEKTSNLYLPDIQRGLILNSIADMTNILLDQANKNLVPKYYPHLFSKTQDLQCHMLSDALKSSPVFFKAILRNQLTEKVVVKLATDVDYITVNEMRIRGWIEDTIEDLDNWELAYKKFVSFNPLVLYRNIEILIKQFLKKKKDDDDDDDDNNDNQTTNTPTKRKTPKYARWKTIFTKMLKFDFLNSNPIVLLAIIPRVLREVLVILAAALPLCTSIILGSIIFVSAFIRKFQKPETISEDTKNKGNEKDKVNDEDTYSYTIVKNFIENKSGFRGEGLCPIKRKLPIAIYIILTQIQLWATKQKIKLSLFPYSFISEAMCYLWTMIAIFFLQIQIDRVSGHKNLPANMTYESVTTYIIIGWLASLLAFGNLASEEFSEISGRAGRRNKAWSERFYRYFFDIWNYVDFLGIIITGLYLLGSAPFLPGINRIFSSFDIINHQDFVLVADDQYAGAESEKSVLFQDPDQMISCKTMANMHLYNGFNSLLFYLAIIINGVSFSRISFAIPAIGQAIGIPDTMIPALQMTGDAILAIFKNALNFTIVFLIFYCTPMYVLIKYLGCEEYTWGENLLAKKEVIFTHTFNSIIQSFQYLVSIFAGTQGSFNFNNLMTNNHNNSGTIITQETDLLNIQISKKVEDNLLEIHEESISARKFHFNNYQSHLEFGDDGEPEGYHEGMMQKFILTLVGNVGWAYDKPNWFDVLQEDQGQFLMLLFFVFITVLLLNGLISYMTYNLEDYMAHENWRERRNYVYYVDYKARNERVPFPLNIQFYFINLPNCVQWIAEKIDKWQKEWAPIIKTENSNRRPKTTRTASAELSDMTGKNSKKFLKIKKIHPNFTNDIEEFCNEFESKATLAEISMNIVLHYLTQDEIDLDIMQVGADEHATSLPMVLSKMSTLLDSAKDKISSSDADSDDVKEKEYEGQFCRYFDDTRTIIERYIQNQLQDFTDGGENDGVTAIHEMFRSRNWDLLRMYFNTSIAVKNKENDGNLSAQVMDTDSFAWPECHMGFNPFDQYLLAGFFPVLKEFSKNPSEEEWLYIEMVREADPKKIELLLDITFPIVREQGLDDSYDRIHDDCNLNQYMKRIQQYYDGMILPIYRAETVDDIVGNLLPKKNNFGSGFSAKLENKESIIRLEVTEKSIHKLEDLCSQLTDLKSWCEIAQNSELLQEVNGLKFVKEDNKCKKRPNLIQLNDFRESYIKRSHQGLYEFILHMDKKYYRKSESGKIDWLPLVISDKNLVKDFAAIVKKNTIKKSYITKYDTKDKIEDIDEWNLSKHYDAILNEIQLQAETYAEKLISKYRDVGKAQLRKRNKKSTSSSDRNLFKSEEGFQAWNPSRFYDGKTNSFSKFESHDAGTWDLRQEKIIREKKRLYDKIKQVVVNRITSFLAMVLYVRSENHKNEMTYFGLVALRRYFREQLKEKTWGDLGDGSKDFNLDDRWNYFLTELLYKLNKYYKAIEEEKEKLSKENTQSSNTISAKVPPLSFTASDSNNGATSDSSHEDADIESIDLPYSLYFDADDLVKMAESGLKRRPIEHEDVNLDGVKFDEDSGDMMMMDEEEMYEGEEY